MKSQNEALTLDDFRLQLNNILKVETELNLAQQKKSQFSIYKISELPISISTVSSWIYFSIHYLWLLFLIFCYINTFNNIFQNHSSWVISLYQFFSGASIIGQILNIPIIILIANSIIFSKKQKTEGISFVFQYIGSKTFPYTRYLIAFCLYSTALFAVSGDILSLIIFALMVLLVLVQTVFLQNFSFRKDQFCCKSFQFLLISRTVTLISLILGIIQIHQVDSISKLLVFKIVEALIGVISLLSYFSFGIYSFRHKVPRVLFFCLNTFYCSISLAMFCDTIQAHQTGQFNFSLYCILFLLIITFLCYHSLDRRRRLSQIPQNSSLKQKIYFIFNIFQSCDIDTQDDCQLRGVLHYHYICGCDNPRCVVNFHQVYDSKKKKLCSIHKIAQSRVSLVKFYVKCLLQKAIEEDPENTQLLLDYVEFYYLKLKNIFQSTKYILKLQSKIITPFQRLRLFRLKKILKEQSNNFSADLYLGKLSMQHIFEAEKTFQTILDGMDIVIARNDLFWRYISRNQVFLTDILQTVKSNFNLVDNLCQKWVSLADYFQINSRWKFYFLCFTIYIKNQKLKPTMFEQFGNSVEYESIFKTSNHFIDKTTEKQALYNPIMLYEQNTCYITASCDQDNMIIRRVSDYFKRYFDYQPKQIEGNQLHILMPPSIRSFHHKMFLEWIKQGRNSNQNCYSIHKVLPMTKKGFLAPSFKFYKSYMRIGSEIEYIGMFKRNKQDEMIILANEKFQIEAITLGLAQKLKIFNDDYTNLQGLNLLMIIPMLAKYTYYSKYLQENDQDFLQQDDNQNYFKKQSTYIKGGNNDQETDILEMRKTLNLTNVKMFIPNDMESSKEEYKLHSQNKETFQAIRECYGSMRKRKGFLKFKGEMYVHSKSQGSPAHRFYEIEINQLQQNNRLQKLKIQQQRSSERMSNKNIEDSRIDEGLMQVDMQMFLQLTKKKNKVVLFPSNNIFLKEENNQALTEINHITNISLSIRIIVAVFIVTLLAILIVEIVLASQFSQINQQYYWVSIHQKMNFLLNSQYNIKHLQSDKNTGIEQSFYIEYYTNFVSSSFVNSNFGALIYDQTINSYEKINPYFQNPYPYPILKNISCPPLDQLDLLYKMKHCAITINRISQLNPSDILENQQYHIFNNYIFSYYTKSQNIKSNLIQSFQSLFAILENTVICLGLSEIGLIIVCLLFSLSRLMKVTNGFSQLLSIFIQMDNADIRKISKFIDYEKILFEHLRDKYNKMKENSEAIVSASSSFLRDLQKPSTEMGDQMMAGIANANLNKKIKKIDLGNEISEIKRTILFLIILFLILVGAVMFLPVIYSRLSLEKVNNLEQLGFAIIGNISLPNSILTGAIQKARNAQIYRFDKYSDFLKNFSSLMIGEDLLKYSSGEEEVSTFFKRFYYQNFCIEQMNVLNQTFETLLPQFCGGSDLRLEDCIILYQILVDQKIAQRCQNIQSTLLRKGTLNFYNSFSNRMLLFFKNAGIVTIKDVIQMNQALNIIGLYDVRLMNIWLNEVSNLISTRTVNVIACIAAAFFGVVLLHIFFVEFLIIKSLAVNYQMFRRMHENMIPEFVINKEKIIKAKLVKQGFMKE